MRAVILAAGVGSRLMPLTRNTPKSLLDLGGGYTLLERQLEALASAGVTEITLVTGYKSEQIEAKIRDFEGFEIGVVFNPFYRLANNGASAWLGLKDLSEPAMIINGDDLFKSSVIASLAESDEDVTMVVSRKDEYDADDMKVVVLGDAVIDVGKGIAPERANAESVGIMQFKGSGLARMQEYLGAMVRVESDLQLFYLEALRRMMSDGHRVSFVQCAPTDWAEVDFHPDLEAMRRQVLNDLEV
jgi:choline kinase